MSPLPDWEKAKAILDKIATQDAAPQSADAPEHIRQASRRFLIMYAHAYGIHAGRCLWCGSYNPVFVQPTSATVK